MESHQRKAERSAELGCELSTAGAQKIHVFVVSVW